MAMDLIFMSSYYGPNLKPLGQADGYTTAYVGALVVIKVPSRSR